MSAVPYHDTPPYPGDKSGNVFADPADAKSDSAFPSDEKRRSGTAALGFHLMNADVDDDDDDEDTTARHDNNTVPPVVQTHHTPMPALAAPRPGYAAPIAALNARQVSPSPSSPGMPIPIAPAALRGPPHQQPYPHMRQPPPHAIAHQRPPASPIQVPSTPHPLPPTVTPIQPVFARPEKPTQQVTFGTPILRSHREDNLARRGEKGDDFWRRFSMIAKEPTAHKESAWLHKTVAGTSRLSRYVWLIGLLILLCIGLGVGFGFYVHTRNLSNVQSAPKAIGGSGQNSGTLTTSIAAAHSGASASSSQHVSPTFTVQRREPAPAPTPLPGVAVHVVHVHHAHKHQRTQRSTAIRRMH